MDPSQYYITTLTAAATKIGPAIAYLLVGYFLFVKLPFLFYLKSMRAQKPKLEEIKSTMPQVQTDQVKDYEKFVKRMKRLDPPKSEEKRKEKAKTEQKKDNPKKQLFPAEAAIFNFSAEEAITKDELRKRYHELLRQNHPDKVAALSPDFKKLADQKTKEINAAYAKLKKNAA